MPSSDEMFEEGFLFMKQCSKCKETKDYTFFNADKNTKDKLRKKCKICRALEQVEWKKTVNGIKSAKKSNRKYYLKTYGLTEKDYTTFLKSQDFKCAICKRQTKLLIDHCHETGKVRGLLCTRCNTLLGRMGDNVAGVLKFLQYLNN